jgi:hypothetical protein
MGDTTSTTTNDTQHTPTPTETALMNNELQLSNAAMPGQISNTLQAQGLQSSLMSGSSLPGYLNTLPGGVSNAQSQNMAQLGVQSLAPQFQAAGGLDSGSYAQAGANAYANTMNQNAQFNVENLAQLMNLASGNAYQNVGEITSNNAMLGSQSGALASSSNQGSYTHNPFLESFYSSFGSAAGHELGSPSEDFNNIMGGIM